MSHLLFFKEGVSEDVDDFGLLCQPVRMALATRVQMCNLPPLLLPAVANEYIRARISYVVGKFKFPCDFSDCYVCNQGNVFYF